MKKVKEFPTPSTIQPVNPQPPMSPNQPCDFGAILEFFHDDFHRSHQTITRHQDDVCFDAYQEIVANYVPYLTATEWIKILGELVAGLYIDPGVMGGQLTSPFVITA